jgi:hypothetical protein
VITDCHHFTLLIADLNIRGCSAFLVVDGGNRIDDRNGVSDEYGFDEPYPIITERNRVSSIPLSMHRAIIIVEAVAMNPTNRAPCTIRWPKAVARIYSSLT